MTREEKLYSMTMACLVQVANRLGVKIDKKGAKAKAVAKILEAEAQQDAKLVPMPGAEKLADVDKEVAKQQSKRASKKQKKVETDDELVAEIMNQKAELGIECPPIESVEIVSETKPETEKKQSKSKKSEKKQSDKEPKISAAEVSERLQSILGKLAVNFIVGKYSVVLRDENKKKYAEICCNKNGLRIYLREDAGCIEKLGDRVENDPSPSGKYTKIVLVATNEMFELVSKLVA